LLKPAPKGTGIKAGGAVRVVLELAGVPNAVSKILGSKNKINNAKATIKALQQLRRGPAKEKPAAAAQPVSGGEQAAA
jgi:small subunit ribosomal protein S5